MKGLLTKEIIVLLKNSKMQLGFVAVFVVFGICSKNPMLIMFAPLLLPMLAKQGLAIDEVCKWDKYSVCFPVDKKKIVSSKYIIILIVSIVAFIITAAAIMVYNIINKESGGPMSGLAVYLAVAVAEAFILPSVSLPLDFKFGSSKGRVFYFIFTGLIAGLVSSLMVKTDNSNLIAKFSAPATLAAVSISVSAVLFIASWLISSKIYESKEI